MPMTLEFNIVINGDEISGSVTLGTFVLRRSLTATVNRLI